MPKAALTKPTFQFPFSSPIAAKIYLQYEDANLRQFVVDEVRYFKLLVFCLFVRGGDLHVQRLLLPLQQILKPRLDVP